MTRDNGGMQPVKPQQMYFLEKLLQIDEKCNVLVADVNRLLIILVTQQ